MSWNKDGPGERDEPRGYHHGNLREALIHAALALIAEKGAGRLHLRRGGALRRRQPGGALSAFSRSRRADGQRRAARLRAVRGGAVARLGRRPARPVRRLQRLGKAYLEFARTQPAYYSAMFEAGIPGTADPPLREAGDRAFAVLRGAADKLCARDAAGRPPPALMVALHVWAMAHGIASLFGRGDGAQRALPMSPDELLEAQTLVYLRGLGVKAPPT